MVLNTSSWLALCMSLALVGVNGSSFLFNMNDDPNESVMLDPSDAQNLEMYNRLVERSAYWSSIVTPAEAGDLSDKVIQLTTAGMTSLMSHSANLYYVVVP